MAPLVEAKTPLDVLSCPRQREYHWHKHDDEDEFFYVVDGELTIELEDRRIGLRPGQAITVPKGLQHRPIAR